jgi:hypothetical protein
MKPSESLAMPLDDSLPEFLHLTSDRTSDHGAHGRTGSRGNPRFAPTLPLHLNFLRPRPKDLTLARPSGAKTREERPGTVQVLAWFLTPEASDGPAPNLPPALRRNLEILGPAKVLFWLAVTLGLGLGLGQLH